MFDIKAIYSDCLTDNFNLNKFPAQLFPFSVYIRLLNVMKGNNKVIIRLIQEKTKIIIATVIAEFDLKIDQEILQFHAPLPPIVIPASGKYYIEVNCNNDIIAKHIIAVIESTSN